MISLENQDSVKRFADRLLRLGMFTTYQIAEIHEPTYEDLEKRIRKLELEIDLQGREHNLNTFVMVYYFGNARMVDRRL